MGFEIISTPRKLNRQPFLVANEELENSEHSSLVVMLGYSVEKIGSKQIPSLANWNMPLPFDEKIKNIVKNNLKFRSNNSPRKQLFSEGVSLQRELSPLSYF